MSLRLFLLAIGLTARAVFAAAELQAPKTVMVGKEVELRLTDGGKPIAQAEIRITSPSAQAATVNTAVAILRSSPFTLSQVKAVTYQGDRLLVLEKRSDNWCLAIAPAGATGFITCESLDVAAYNGPLGFTDAQGNFSTANLAVAPSTIEVTAFRNNQPIACTKLRVDPYTYDRTETITKSITYRERRFVRADGDGPFTMQILEVDPTDPDLDILPVRANDRAIGR
ncbi:MAG TPA: SH3 domain-containing protein, partial [Bryobacteraceae bacterium]|nr:SH3 domain-containing protein [Bryobacteraceae bacterium]